MSIGKIKSPTRPNLSENKHERNIQETVYDLTKTLEVEVDDTLWEESLATLRSELEEKEIANNSEVNEIYSKISAIEARLGEDHGNVSDELKDIRNSIDDLKKRKPLEIIIKKNKDQVLDLGLQHEQLPTLIEILTAGLNAYIVGSAGSGKSTAAEACAKALGVPFYFTGAIASEYKLTGFMDANGKIVSTEFRKAYENGGLFLFDEIDASYPQAVLAFNAALANNHMDFPDKRVPKHKNFYCIAAANTYGQGADRMYVGRNQLDAASLDRFAFLDWNIDENLERALANNDDWVDRVQHIRSIINELEIRHIVSPRASIDGAKLLAAGMEQEKVEKLKLWKGLDQTSIEKILENIGEYAG